MKFYVLHKKQVFFGEPRNRGSERYYIEISGNRWCFRDLKGKRLPNLSGCTLELILGYVADGEWIFVTQTRFRAELESFTRKICRRQINMEEPKPRWWDEESYLRYQAGDTLETMREEEEFFHESENQEEVKP